MTIDLATGSELAGHRIDSVIGRGGMGVVYLAQHLRLGRRVALKVLVPELAKDEVFRERFIRESQLAAALEHPNVIPIYDAGEVQDVLYISMRYVEGSDLSVWLRQDGTLSAEDTLTVMEQVGSALDTAHREGLVHRDVKPANVLIDQPTDGGRRVFLTDFGITKRLRREGDSLTRAGQLIGTIDYMAPEQITGQRVDGRTDVYSLGCIIYRCLTGTVPYPRDNEVAVMYAHLQETPPPIVSERPELPDAVDKVVRKAMAKARDARFATCGEFMESLRPQLTAPRAQPSKRRRGVSTAPSVTPPAVRPSRRRRRAWWAGSAAALVVVVAVLAALLLGSKHGTVPPAGANGPSATASSSASPSQTPSPTPVDFSWTPIVQRVFKGSGNQTINRIIKINGLLLAVGYTTTNGRNDAAVWTSQDGTNWGQQPVASGPGDQGIAGVAPFGSGYVAVGSDQPPGGALNAAVWKSQQAAIWDRVLDTDPPTFGGPKDQQMRRAEAVAGEVVAVGYSGPNAAVWRYDGTGWVAPDSDSFRRPGHSEEMWGIAAQGQNLVVVGSDCATRHLLPGGPYGSTCPAGELDAAAWFSSDRGLDWGRVPMSELHREGDQQMTTVVAGGPGFVAVGYDTFSGTKDAAVWTSPDGMHWSEVPVSGELGGVGDQEMKGVITVDGNLVAVGFDDRKGDLDGAVWTSIEGRTWSESLPKALGGRGGQQIKSVVFFHGHLIAVGRNRNANHNENAAVWVATVSPAG